jgi:hypothetical protein
MMKIELIEANVDQTLELRGLVKEGNEQQVRLLLYHLYVSVSIWKLMSFDERFKALRWKKILGDVFSLKNYLKKRKNKKDKVFPSSALLPIEKEIKEKEVEITIKGKRDFDATVMRKQEEFWKTLMPYKEKYGQSMLERFQAYWAAPVNGTTTLLWEKTKTWSVSYRLKSWSKSPIELNAQNAEIRLERTRKKNAQQAVSTEAQKQIAAQREADNARREKELAESKASAASMEEVTQGDPNRLSTLNKLLATKFTASP